VRHSQQLVWLVTGSLFAIAVALTIPVAVRNPDPVGNPVAAAGLLVFFGLSYLVPLRFDVRRQGFSVSVSDLPLLLALFYLPPLAVLLVRLVAGTAMQVIRRHGVVKSFFNVSGFAAGTAAANVVVYYFRSSPGLPPRVWLVLAAAVFVNSLVTLAGVGAVMVIVQGPKYLPQFARTAAVGQVVTALNITVGLIMLLALEASKWAVLLLAGLAVVLCVVYRAYAQFLRQHKSLAEIHEITRAISESGAQGSLADVMLGRLRRLLQAESATLWLPARGRHPEVLLTAMVDYHGLLDRAMTPDSVRRLAMDSGEPVAVGPRFGTDALRAELRELGTKDAIVVPLRSGSAVVGTLEVAGRLGDVAHFGADDVRLVETLAAHVAIAVENSRLVDRLRYDAYHDALTSLPNRRRLLGALAEAINARTPDEVVAVMQFDVVGLRSVNEALGHGAGDRLLAKVARRLRTLAPADALVARVGGDEFAVTLRAAGPDAALAVADQIRAQLREAMMLDALTIDVDTTVGVAVNPDHGDDPETLLQRADVATYAAKLAAVGSQLYHAGLESRSVRRLGFAADLRRALDRDEIDVYFQPQVALSDRRLVGVECLARWEHAVYGSLPPEDFVAVAEHTGQIGRLTHAVMREGLRRAREWADAGRSLSVAVNLSPRSLIDADFPRRVAELLDQYGVSADRLTLEFAEDRVLGDGDRALPVLHRLRDMGVRLAVDDFGTGYSSLAFLRRLPVHEVKIDRTFVQGMATDHGDRAIVRAVVDLSRHLGLSVVAEGVESELTLRLLTEVDCDLGQGFLFSRPLPYERLDAWLQARTEAERTAAGEVRRLRVVP
jgi:diguanylate cyclase (GGDEF)-like protein